MNDDEEELEAQELEELGPSSMDMKIVRNHHHYDQLLPPTFFLWLRLTCADHDVSQVFAENLARTEVSFKYSFRVAALLCPAHFNVPPLSQTLFCFLHMSVELRVFFFFSFLLLFFFFFLFLLLFLFSSQQEGGGRESGEGQATWQTLANIPKAQI